ncbi:MAG: Asp-tRNA(Asn)/Glu-tRNA(Gln) amidotransferase subunit GatA [Deltaproteobacteria bacterium]|jgi:aspartyl-tRNA(Asn)/glutamyl-tRNA(Gln) amidotransferase subunit A|nr:Asp-tRNA(Asn)/Glu-tRNA(Gln) amidotransferase subunit GatA [Deltaproteobacteria bacterium]
MNKLQLCELSLSRLARGLQDKEYSVAEAVESSLERIEATEPKLHACISILADEAREQASQLDKQGPQKDQALWGVPVGLKDLICLKGSRTTCGSRFLEHFTPFYDAEVAARIKNAGAVALVKNNMDEFAMGSTTENSWFGRTANPWDLERVPGGSSGGSAASVAAGQVFASLGSDTGGSIRQPAGFCGCVGLKPTYGRVSRYGVVAFGSSFDQVGPITRTVEDCARVFEVLAGPDAKDSTSARLDLYPQNLPAQDFVVKAVQGQNQEPADTLKGLKIGVPEEFWESGLEMEVKSTCGDILKKLEAQGATLVPVSLPNQKFALAVYYIMASAEASTNLARFDGVRYGRRADKYEDLLDLYVASRSQGFGAEVQRRIMLGTFVLSSGYYDAYYRKAAQIRRLLLQDFENALNPDKGGCHMLLAPTSPCVAWKFGSLLDDPLTLYKMDLLTVTLNLVGLPGLALSAGLGRESGMPVGLQIMGRPFDEAALLRLGATIEKITPKLEEPRGLRE